MDNNKRTEALEYGGIAVLLLRCLFDIPCGFYSYVLFSATAAFCYLACKACKTGNKERVFF